VAGAIVVVTAGALLPELNNTKIFLISQQVKLYIKTLNPQGGRGLGSEHSIYL
jgi:hypothetical protein